MRAFNCCDYGNPLPYSINLGYTKDNNQFRDAQKNTSEVRPSNAVISQTTLKRKHFLRNLAIKKPFCLSSVDQNKQSSNETSQTFKMQKFNLKQKKVLTEIPNITISSENEDNCSNQSFNMNNSKLGLTRSNSRDPELVSKKNSNCWNVGLMNDSEPVEAWNGMINSISELKESPDAQSPALLSYRNLEIEEPVPDWEGTAERKCIFTKDIDNQSSPLQTPEFGLSAGGFYKPPNDYTNSSKILSEIYEKVENNYDVDELAYTNFVKKENNKLENFDAIVIDSHSSADPKEVSEISKTYPKF